MICGASASAQPKLSGVKPVQKLCIERAARLAELAALSFNPLRLPYDPLRPHLEFASPFDCGSLGKIRSIL
jgi:hypothetical protein